MIVFNIDSTRFGSHAIPRWKLGRRRRPPSMLLSQSLIVRFWASLPAPNVTLAFGVPTALPRKNRDKIATLAFHQSLSRAREFRSNRQARGAYRA